MGWKIETDLQRDISPNLTVAFHSGFILQHHNSAGLKHMQTRDKLRLLKSIDFCVSHQSGFAEFFPPHIQNIFHFRLIALSESWARSPSFHPNQERSRVEAVPEELASPAGESRAHPAPEGTVTCPGSLQGPAQHHSADDSSLNPFMEPGEWGDWVPQLVCVPQDFPRNWLHKERQECACPEQSEKCLSVIYTAVQMGKLALLDFKLLYWLNVWRNTDWTHAVLAAVLALPKSRSQREQPKAQLPEGTAASPALQLTVCAWGRKARGRGAEDAAAEWVHREWAEPAVRGSICLGTGGCSPRTETCSQNKNLMRHRKPLWPLSCLQGQILGIYPELSPSCRVCTCPAPFATASHTVAFFSCFGNSFCKQLKPFLL